VDCNYLEIGWDTFRATLKDITLILEGLVSLAS